MRLLLQGHTNNWEKFKQRKQNPTFRKIRADILTRDKHTCRFCGYRSALIEVVNADNNYSNNKKANLICACTLCAKCTLLDAYTLDYAGSDKMIYLPEISQEQLNQLCRVLFCQAIGAENGEIGYNAKMVLAQLQDRANWLDTKTACSLSQPAIFLHYAHGGKTDPNVLNKLRWLPDIESYRDAIPTWQNEMSGIIESLN
ncbi:MAG: type IVB secretion system protein IcmJDotN [Gammaproteobacteria bacterium]|nr:type IVB secretion system protein IcmJDotN [Gammaproteobacteria bacterium]